MIKIQPTNLKGKKISPKTKIQNIFSLGKMYRTECVCRVLTVPREREREGDPFSQEIVGPKLSDNS
ncbi:hypothetical protein BpHYR1_050982 [Brachionus plicatilis]|uniref:Uncharacterized protein n=1 Tax=Brachionus plicatilis TaxID=10195 RepID=A0A3M7QX89_BRAPC|nr:hypothetical protein BpHYR1_050982 [Brachionus plicatilis]